MQRVVRVDWFSRIDGNRVEWFTTFDAGKRRLEQLKGNPHMVRGRVTTVFVPAKRTDLVAWLNDNLKSANV